GPFERFLRTCPGPIPKIAHTFSCNSVETWTNPKRAHCNPTGEGRATDFGMWLRSAASSFAPDFTAGIAPKFDSVGRRDSMTRKLLASFLMFGLVLLVVQPRNIRAQSQSAQVMPENLQNSPAREKTD